MTGYLAHNARVAIGLDRIVYHKGKPYQLLVDTLQRVLEQSHVIEVKRRGRVDNHLLDEMQTILDIPVSCHRNLKLCFY